MDAPPFVALRVLAKRLLLRRDHKRGAAIRAASTICSFAKRIFRAHVRQNGAKSWRSVKRPQKIANCKENTAGKPS